MRWRYSPITHQTIVSHIFRLLPDARGSGDRHPLTIPRREVRYSMPGRTIRDDRTVKRYHACGRGGPTDKTNQDGAAWASCLVRLLQEDHIPNP
jgi:hypothetical protein